MSYLMIAKLLIEPFGIEIRVIRAFPEPRALLIELFGIEIGVEGIEEKSAADF